MKNQNGVTLVEIIVVAVIVAVLASVGIPIYSGYIRDQRQTTVNNLAETAAASANTYWRRTGVNVTDADLLPRSNTLGLYYQNSEYSMTVIGNNINVAYLAKPGIYNSVSYK